MKTETMLSNLKEQDDSPSATSVTGRSAKKDDEISLLDLLIVLAERKRTILGITAAFALLAVVVSLLLPKRYTATVILLPPQQSTTVSTAITSQLSSLGSMASLAGGSLGLKNTNDIYVAMLQSQTVENAMIQRFGLMQEYHAKYLSDARSTFEHNTTIDGNGKDGLIHISIEDHDPRRAADLANGYVDQFRNLSEHLAITEAGQRGLFYQQQLEKAKDKLADAEEALKESELKTGLIQLDSQAKALIESAASVRAQISAKEVEIQVMQTYATGENSQLIEANQELVGLRAQLAKLVGSEENSDGLIVPKGNVPAAGLEYVRKLRDVKYYETLFDTLARQFELAKLDEAKEGAIIQIVDPAIPPDRRSFPKRSLIVIGATIAGFFIGVFMALLQAGFVRMKADQEASNKLALLKSTMTFRRSAVASVGYARKTSQER
jgi:tyrosine-protein kinase Etk/Wzc